MLDVHDLEARYRRYKIKSYIPYVVITSSIIVIALSISFFISNNQNISTSNKPVTDSNNTKISNTKNSTDEKIVINKDSINEEQSISKKVSLSPSMSFIHKIESKSINNTIKEDIKPEQIEIKIEEVKNTKVAQKHIDSNKIEKDNIIKTNTSKEQIQNTKSIKISKDDQDIQHVIKRFKQNNNPALSLFVAKKYYKIGEYNKAYNYALITNGINNNIEESWIIFAKSLVKLNKRDMAISTLKKYIDNSHSSQARILLDEILSGKFK